MVGRKTKVECLHLFKTKKPKHKKYKHNKTTKNGQYKNYKKLGFKTKLMKVKNRNIKQEHKIIKETETQHKIITLKDARKRNIKYGYKIK